MEEAADRESFGDYLEMIGDVRDFLDDYEPGESEPDREDVRCRELSLAGLAVLEARHPDRGTQFVYNFEDDCWEESSQELEEFLARCEGKNPRNPDSMFGA